jgi:hypothetical protein
MSTSTGVAPQSSIAATVATAVWETVMTSSPGPMPQPRSARCRASVPLPTPTPDRTPQYAANSASNARTSSPRMYRPLSSTRAIAPSISGLSAS